MIAQHIVLARHVDGLPAPDNFAIENIELPELKDNQFLIQNAFVSADPGMRSLLSQTDSYAAALPIGARIDGFGVGRVLESRNPSFPIGALVTMGSGWATHGISNGRGYCALLPELGVPLSSWIGVLGVPGMTAYFSLKRVAQMKAGERVVVTSAAGPVGATTGQLARAWGASQVVGIASAGAKSDWLVQEANFDQVIDYRSDDFETQIAQAMPEGIDVLVDNVGNAMIDRLLPYMRPRGRIVVSGQVADYNIPPSARWGIKNTDLFITHRLRMEGLVVFDDLRDFPAAQAECAALIGNGQLKFAEVISNGLETLPQAFCELFQPSAVFGRRIAKLA